MNGPGDSVGWRPCWKTGRAPCAFLFFLFFFLFFFFGACYLFLSFFLLPVSSAIIIVSIQEMSAWESVFHEGHGNCVVTFKYFKDKYVRFGLAMVSRVLAQGLSPKLQAQIIEECKQLKSPFTDWRPGVGLLLIFLKTSLFLFTKIQVHMREYLNKRFQCWVLINVSVMRLMWFIQSHSAYP